MWFDSWSDLWRIAVVGTAAYATLLSILRVSGQRSLAKLNAFDLVVTVALGSTLATILSSTDVSWADGTLALALLVLLQFVVAWTSVRLPGMRSVVSARPILLLRDGEPLEEVLHAQRMTVGDLRQAVRASGHGSLGDVAAVVLESNGELSVISRSKLGDGSALHGLDDATGADVPG